MSQHAETTRDGSDPAVAETAMLAHLSTSLAEARSAIASLQALEITLLAAGAALADEQMSRLASTASREREMPLRTIAAEIGTATRMSDRTVQRRIDEAVAITTGFPCTFRALSTGRIDRAHVTAILDAGAAITDSDIRAAYELATVAYAQRETPARLRAFARVVAARLDTAAASERRRIAHAQRSVVVVDLDDGMAALTATLPATIAYGILDRLTRFAKTVVEARSEQGGADAGASAASSPVDSYASTASEADLARDTRTFPQLRADVLADILLTAHATTAAIARDGGEGVDAIHATVHVVIPVLSLLDRDHESTPPALLSGHGPIDDATARRLAGNATGWDRVLTHPISGEVLTVDRYQPSEQQRRMLRARDQHCRFPGCRIPPHRSDIDHTIDAALGGPTAIENLAHLCRRHHSLKHASAWTVRQSQGGVLTWTSPTGRVHTDTPVSTAWFAAADDPPPF